MAKLDVLNLQGEKVSDIKLSDTVWNIEINTPVLTQAIKLALASLRQGTHKTKDRSEVAGGGRKPWKQKGTGRARAGSNRSPLWPGGGVTFGPTPRSYSKKMNKKERALALKSALSDKYKNNELIVVESLNITDVKTKEMVKTLNTLNAMDKTLMVTNLIDNKIVLSTRNLEKVLTLSPASINVLDIVNANKLIIDVESVKKIEEVLK